MADKCANHWCPAVRHDHEGKLFRLDLDLGSTTGKDEHRTTYIWLCTPCANRMHPKVEVAGNSVLVRLSKNDPTLATSTDALLRLVN